MAIERIDPELCTGCGTCIEACIMDVIRMDEENKKAFIKYPGDCMTCFCCELDCPQGAVSINSREKAPLIWG
jgi:NAD-dependent dihydropyrimidine dehydrogenase PreA subunit